MNILIVDDIEENCYLLEALFKGNGYNIYSASNGSQALEILRSQEVNLVVSDILMPVMDGFELCRQMKKDENLKNTPFIFYTATYTSSKDEEFALKLGADKFITKPCEPIEFLKAIREVISDTNRKNVSVELLQDKDLLKLYNERLVKKLEQKMLQLEEETNELKRTRDTLKSSEEKYRKLYESMMDGFAMTEMTGKIIETNQSFRDMVGFSVEELSRMTYLDLTPKEWQRQEESIIQEQILKRGYSDVYEREFIKKDKNSVPVEIRAFLIRDNNGKEEGVWAIIRDISARKDAEKKQKHLESQLHQAQKMESIGRLAGGIAHDFNNLLSIIMGYCDLMLMKMPETDPHYKKLDMIYQTTIRARDLTKQLLAFSRKQVLSMNVVDLNGIVKNFENLIRRLIGEDIQLNISLSKNPLMIRGDSSQLEQVLMNLAVNARDAMPKGGILRIETSSLEVDETLTQLKTPIQPGLYASITVSDNGTGIEEEIIESIFEPFFTTKDVGKGTGLGLATSYGIISQHGGTIIVYSELGKGSIFKIFLPLDSEKASHSESHSSNPELNKGTSTVLLVEDDDAVLEIVQSILTANGYKVLSANDPDIALEISASYQEDIHLVISDIIMPKMKGPEVFKKIREAHPESKSLYMSGYTSNAISNYKIVNEDINFIEKPFTVKQLLNKMKSILES